MKIAVIDLGTNTFNLLLTKQSGNTFEAIKSTKEFVQLGKGGINKGLIAEDAFQRGLDCLSRFKEIAVDADCDKIIAIATSSIRNAKNGKEFVQQVHAQFDIQIQTIDGDQEANYIYHGAKNACDLLSPSLIMDVGGGSTEFIICDENKILWKQSIEIGAARLYEAFHQNDPITPNEIGAIKQHLEDKLAPLKQALKTHSIKKLVGCSGAFSSFAAVIEEDLDKDDVLEEQINYRFDHGQFYRTHRMLLSSTLEERLKLQGLVKERAPMIVVGSILVNYVLSLLGAVEFELSKYALKEGVIYSEIVK